MYFAEGKPVPADKTSWAKLVNESIRKYLKDREEKILKVRKAVALGKHVLDKYKQGS